MMNNGFCRVCGCPPDPWLPVRPVAARLCVCVQTVYKLIRERNIQGIKVGGQWRIRHSSLDAYVQRREEAVPLAVRA